MTNASHADTETYSTTCPLAEDVKQHITTLVGRLTTATFRWSWSSMSPKKVSSSPVSTAASSASPSMSAVRKFTCGAMVKMRVIGLTLTASPQRRKKPQWRLGGWLWSPASLVLYLEKVAKRRHPLSSGSFATFTGISGSGSPSHHFADCCLRGRVVEDLMSRRQIDPLRPLTAEDRGWLARISRSHSEPVAHVAWVRVLLAVAAGWSVVHRSRVHLPSQLPQLLVVLIPPPAFQSTAIVHGARVHACLGRGMLLFQCACVDCQMPSWPHA